ncbi:MAG: NTP transferase domain-containing protein [Sandaracinaceae bacterium]
MEVLAIVPARGGSTGIVRKNVRPLGGRPLIAWTLAQARRTPAITRLVVSTDDTEIADVSRAWGAEVVERPEHLAGATASSESALIHTLTVLEEEEGYVPDAVVFLQCTSPFRQPDDIQRAVETFIATGADSLFSACPTHGFVWRVDPLRGPTALNYEPTARPRRQDAPTDVVENGSIYVFSPSLLRDTGSRLGGRIAVHTMRMDDSFQVDEPDDLPRLEALLAHRAPAELPRTRLAGLSLVCLDFDGVLTPNRVMVDQFGIESVTCHRGDGWGIARLREAGVSVVVVSTEENPVVSARCRKLGIPCEQGVRDKRALVSHMIRDRGLDPARVAFVGNDVNDLGAMDEVGVPIAVADATEPARAAAVWVTNAVGGDGAVREVADRILDARAARAVRRVA